MYFRQERGTWTGILFSIAKNHWPIISDVDWTAIWMPHRHYTTQKIQLSIFQPRFSDSLMQTKLRNNNKKGCGLFLWMEYLGKHVISRSQFQA
jgi:hypothetical protein